MVAFQWLVMIVPAGRSSLTRQSGRAVAPPLVTVMRPTYPAGHVLSWVNTAVGAVAALAGTGLSVTARTPAPTTATALGKNRLMSIDDTGAQRAAWGELGPRAAYRSGRPPITRVHRPVELRFRRRTVARSDWPSRRAVTARCNDPPRSAAGGVDATIRHGRIVMDGRGRAAAGEDKTRRASTRCAGRHRGRRRARRGMAACAAKGPAVTGRRPRDPVTGPDHRQPQRAAGRRHPADRHRDRAPGAGAVLLGYAGPAVPGTGVARPGHRRRQRPLRRAAEGSVAPSWRL